MNLHYATLLFVTLMLGACASITTRHSEPLHPLQSVDSVEIDRYLGTWFEVAHFPQFFQRNCTATQATYSLREDGMLRVQNLCRKGSPDGKLDVATGRARVVPDTGNAQLEVSFFGPFWGDYWIIELAEDYSYAVVGHPDRDYLWILSRTRQMEESLLGDILERLKVQHQYDLEPLRMTVQPPGL